MTSTISSKRTPAFKVIDVTYGAKVTGSEEAIGRLRASLTFANKYTKAVTYLYRPLDIQQYSQPAGDLAGLVIPRGCVAHQASGSWDYTPMRFTGNLRPDQKRIADAYRKHIETRNGGIIKSGTGTGKTVIMIEITSSLRMPTLVIVPTSYLMGQWRERLKTFSNLTDADIGIIRADRCETKGKSVVLGMLHSVCKEGRYDESTYDRFGLVVWDEVHTMPAETFAESGWLFHSKYRLGASATPRRKDGMDSVFFYHIGAICNESSIPARNPRVIFAKYDGEDASDNGCVWRGELGLGRYYNKLEKSTRRSRFIADIIAKAYRKKRTILMLSDRLGIISDVEAYLIRDFQVMPEDVGIFTGSTKIGLDRQVILGTYGAAGLGADIPAVNTIVLATPRVDVEQNIGRGLRDGGADDPLVIDIVDTASPVMVGWSKSRKKFYQQIATSISEA